MKSLSAALCAFLLSAPIAFAKGGNGGGNGGDLSIRYRSIVNLAELIGPDKGLKEYDGLGVGHLLAVGLDNGDERLMENAIFDYIKAHPYNPAHDPGEAEELKSALDSLTFKTSEIVPKVKTGFHEPAWQAFLGNDERDALAYQDFDSHTVYEKQKCEPATIDAPVQSNRYIFCVIDHGIQEIHSLGRVFLKIHEAYIRLGKDRGLDRISAETMARSRIEAIVSDPEFDRKIIGNIMDSNSFTNALYSENLNALWQDLGISGHTNSTSNRPKDLVGVADHFVATIKEIGFTCNADDHSIRHFAHEMAEENKSAGAGILSHTVGPIFGRLCQLEEPVPPAFSERDPESIAVKVPAPPQPFITFGPGTFHPSVSKSMYVEVVPFNPECRNLPVLINLVKPGKNNTLVTIYAHTNEATLVPNDWTAESFNMLVYVQDCKYDTAANIFVKADPSEPNAMWNLMSTPSLHHDWEDGFLGWMPPGALSWLPMDNADLK